MSISVTCSCGKKLTVKDEWAGKKGKCPTCGSTFQIPAAGPAVNPWGNKSRAPATTAKEAKLHISPKMLALLIAAITIPTLLFLIRIGPVKARHDWDKVSEQADYDVRDVYNRALQAWLSQHTLYNPRDPRHTPTSSSPTFVVTAWMMSMPSSVGFVGKTDEGLYKGTYRTHTGEIDGTMEVRGQTVHVTGHVHEGAIESFIDGEPAKLIEKPLDTD